MAELKPRITSLGHAVPNERDGCVVDMQEWCAMLGYSSPHILQLARNTQIKTKRWWSNPIGKSVQELSEEYIKGALQLSCQAIEECLPGLAGLQNIGTFIFVSTTQQLEVCPGMTFRIAGELEMPSQTRLVDIISDGCQGSVPGLETAYAHLLAFREPVLLVTTEICSSTFFPADERDIQNVVSNIIFQDGAAALLLDYSDCRDFPAILDFERLYDKKGLDLLGYIHQDGRMKVVLSRLVPQVIPPMAAKVVNQLLERNSLSIGDISNWCVHSGGVAILNQIAACLQLDSEKDFRYSWEVLRDFGNMSSATVGVVAKRIHAHPENRHGYTVSCTMGAGGQVGAVLAKYG